MYPMCVWLIALCVVCYLYKNNTMKIYDIPLWIIVLCFLVFSYMFSTEDEEFTNTKPQIVVYNFNTTWCGWSKRFQPEWDQFTQLVKNMDNVTAKDMKCDDKPEYQANNDIAKKYQVPGFPYVIILVDNVPSVYKGTRTADALLEHVKKLSCN